MIIETLILNYDFDGNQHTYFIPVVKYSSDSHSHFTIKSIICFLKYLTGKQSEVIAF